jgi:hypothetical protein
MIGSENDRQALELGVVWDRLAEGGQAEGTGADPALVSTILLVDQIDRESPMSAELQDAIWAGVIAGTGEMWRPDAMITESARLAESPGASATVVAFNQLTRWAGIIAAGFVGGFIAGIGSRLFMRLAGFLTVDANRFKLTENDEQVGEITLGGTLSLGFLGAGAGVVTILIYLALRNRLPFDGWRRSATFAVLLLVVFGYVIMDPSNPDYQLFGPTWLNVSTFSSLYLLMGFCCAQTYELGRHLGGRLGVARRSLALQVPLMLISAAICAFGALVTLISLFVGAPGLIVVAVAGLAWLVNRFLVQGRISFSWMPAAVRPWGVLVVPGILGFILTARGITEILTQR